MRANKNTCIVIGSAPTVGDLGIGWGLVELLKDYDECVTFEFWTKHPAEYRRMAEMIGVKYRIQGPLLNWVQRRGAGRLKALRSRVSMWSAVRRARCVVYQGGPRWSRSSIGPKSVPKLDSNLILARLAKRQGVPVLNVGASLGPVGENDVELPHWKKVRQVLDGSAAFLARDSFSQNAAEALGLHSIFRGQSHDTALAIDPPESDEQTASGREVVAVCLREFQSSYGISQEQFSEAVRSVVSVLENLARDGSGVVSVPMTFESGRGLRSDLDVLREAFSRTQISPDHPTAPLDPLSVMERLSRSSFAITMRMHVAILAARVGVPSIALGYSDKSFDFMKSLAMERFTFDIRDIDPDTLEARCREMQANLPDIRNHVNDRIQDMRSQQRRLVRAVLEQV
jgi:polysaccharide pyruvyl transferase WcaK-like protein